VWKAVVSLLVMMPSQSEALVRVRQSLSNKLTVKVKGERVSTALIEKMKESGQADDSLSNVTRNFGLLDHIGYLIDTGTATGRVALFRVVSLSRFELIEKANRIRHAKAFVKHVSRCRRNFM
jgi:hypothetical protein